MAEDTWLRDVLKATEAAHTLHVFDVSDERCLSRLRARNAAGSHQFAVTDAQFHRFSAHFALPTAEEGFDLVVQNEAGEAVPEP
ncbi:MAG TPA: AAA family ATPase [Roseovarius sp.]|nr:AAA family ATPase [Roseovarius sp.]HMB13193.1 AAA family ATPase [Roseovarius sp.]